jgi:hypothetical protein
MQRGGYGEDPAGIWDHDEVAESLGMIKWLQNATPEAKQRDEEQFRAMQEEKKGIRARALMWTIAIPVDWMAEYEDPDVIEARRANRPKFSVD